MRVPADSIIKRAVELFSEYGGTITLDENDWEDEFTLGEARLIKNDEIPVNRFGGEIEIDLYDLLTARCLTNGYILMEYQSDQVFDSPGLDIYVMSFVIKDIYTDEIHYSLNNVYERT